MRSQDFDYFENDKSAQQKDERYSLIVNGLTHAICSPAGTPLLHVIRNQLELTGAKEACGRGECGACTVLVDGRPILSCIAMAADITGDITTIEGMLQQTKDVREAFADFGAFQCGFCTPGQIVRAQALLNESWPQEIQSLRDFVAHAMSGNICRCTGYVGIVDAVIHVARSRGKVREEQH